eukprot:gene8398-1307_t
MGGGAVAGFAWRSARRRLFMCNTAFAKMMEKMVPALSRKILNEKMFVLRLRAAWDFWNDLDFGTGHGVVTGRRGAPTPLDAVELKVEMEDGTQFRVAAHRDWTVQRLRAAIEVRHGHHGVGRLIVDGLVPKEPVTLAVVFETVGEGACWRAPQPQY